MSLLAFFLPAFLSTPAAASTCEYVTTCEYVGSHEECYYNRRGALVCRIIADEECETTLECYDDGNLGGGDCFYLVGDPLEECLQG